MARKLKIALLRIEKNFGQTIFEPLKQALIDHSTPKFTNLVKQATHHRQGIIAACKVWNMETYEVCTNIESAQE